MICLALGYCALTIWWAEKLSTASILTLTVAPVASQIINSNFLIAIINLLCFLNDQNLFGLFLPYLVFFQSQPGFPNFLLMFLMREVTTKANGGYDNERQSKSWKFQYIIKVMEGCDSGIFLGEEVKIKVCSFYCL